MWQDGRSYYNVQILISSDGFRWQRVYGAVDTVQTSSGTEVLLGSLSPTLPFYVIPSNYSYDIQPHTDYPDSNNIELTDGVIVGHYYSGNDNTGWWKPWVAWYRNSPTITFNFKMKVTITKVSIHFQGDRAGGIYLPTSVSIGGTLFNVGDLGMNGWQDFIGVWSGSSVSVKLTYSNGWIFISEVIFTELSTNPMNHQDCSKLTSLVIPSSVITIEDYAYYQCTNLRSVTIPSSVTYIGKYAFQGCPFTCINNWNPTITRSIGTSALPTNTICGTIIAITFIIIISI